MSRKQVVTHEQFIAGVAALAIARIPDASAFAGMKLSYGMGADGAYGVTYFKRWKAGDEPTAFVEIGARHQANWQQVATTVVHELGHVLAGWEAGHEKAWKEACEALGLRRARAVGKHPLAMLEPSLRAAIVALPKPTEGNPICPIVNRVGKPVVFKPCGGGTGTRGGKCRGVGSGSRLRLFECECVPVVKVRASRDTLAAHCDMCEAGFHLVH